jgi:modulator of FtsH protease HflK
MPWQSGNGDGKNPWGNNPWGGGGGQGGGNGGGGDGDEPRNPWGNRGGGGGGGKGGGGPDLDDLLRQGRDRLRSSLPGGGGRSIWGIAAAGIAILWLATTTFYRVDAGEVGVIQRLGQFNRVTAPGLNFKLPAPLETLTKVSVEQSRSIEIGGGDEQGENLVLTGDQNIVDIAYTVRWRVKDAPDFLFNIANAETTIQEVAESAMREAVSRTPLNAAIGQQRSQIATSVQQRMQDVLDSYNAGVEVIDVLFKQVDPPQAVDQAFKDVSAAQQDAQRFLNQANAYRQQLVARAQGEAARFNAVYIQYKAAPEVTRKRIYLETMEEVFGGMNKVIVDGNSGTLPVLPLTDSARRQAAAQAVVAASQTPSQ